MALACVARLPEQLTLGIRPEHLRLCAAGAPNAIAAEVVLDEDLGREHVVHLRRGALDLRVLTQGVAAQPIGSQVHVAIDWPQVYLFDPQTGFRLSAQSIA